MKTLTLIVLIGVFGYCMCHPFFGINVQITGADYSLSPKISANFANATSLASALITPSAPIPLKNLYYQYSDFWPLNDIAYQFVYGARNTSMALMYLFNNLTAAAADNTNYPGVFAKLNTTIANALATLFIDVNPPFAPPFALNSFMSISADLAVELNKLLALINAMETGIAQFKLSGLSLTSANVLKYIPALADVTTLLRSFFAISSYFVGNVSFTTTYMNNSYNVVKFSDATFTGIEAQLNATLKGRDVMVNSTEIYLNLTLAQFMTSINTSYANSKKLLPSNWTKDPEFIKNMSDFDTDIYGFVSSVGFAKDNYYQSLESYKVISKQAMISWYQSDIMSLFNSMRTSLFGNLMMNKSYLACGQNLVTTVEARFKAMGGASSAFACSQVDSPMFKKINATIQIVPNITSTDLDRVWGYPWGYPWGCFCHRWIWIWSNGRWIRVIRYYWCLRRCWWRNIWKYQYFEPYLWDPSWISFNDNLWSTCSSDYMNYALSVFTPSYTNYSTCVKMIT